MPFNILLSLHPRQNPVNSPNSLCICILDLKFLLLPPTPYQVLVDGELGRPQAGLGGGWANADNWPLGNLELIVINLIWEAQQHKSLYLRFSGSLVRKRFIVAL